MTDKTIIEQVQEKYPENSHEALSLALRLYAENVKRIIRKNIINSHLHADEFIEEYLDFEKREGIE